MFQVINHQGLAFNVRVVQDGDRYGLDDCLVNRGAPLVEFYDATYAGDPRFGERGQFVSRYTVPIFEDAAAAQRGLMLDGGIPEWCLDEFSMELAARYVRKVLGS